MREGSQRLLALLHGDRVARPPFWEPWFGMTEMLARRYGGDALKMADDLGHAAVGIGYLNAGTDFYRKVERIPASGVWYGGGVLTDARQLHDAPRPDFAAQRAALRPKRERLAQAGIASWLVYKWCFHAIATSMGLEEFALACCDRPDFVREAMEWAEARNRQVITEIIAPLRPDFVLVDGDCAYKTGTMIHPDMLRDFCGEPTRQTLARLRELGIPVIFHSDGKLDDLIPFLIDLGIAGVHGCESAANDLGHLVEKFGDQIVLCGNMDVVFLKKATVTEVREATREMLRVGSRRGKFLAGCNTSPLDYIPEANYRAFAEEIALFSPPT
jgi:hypothetical protein